MLKLLLETLILLNHRIDRYAGLKVKRFSEFLGFLIKVLKIFLKSFFKNGINDKVKKRNNGVKKEIKNER